MLADLAQSHPVIRETFAEASEGAGVDLWSLAQQGPEETLNQTEYTQPALLAAGVAVWRALQAQGGPQPAMLAGHSLGEYTPWWPLARSPWPTAPAWCASAAA